MLVAHLHVFHQDRAFAKTLLKKNKKAKLQISCARLLLAVRQHGCRAVQKIDPSGCDACAAKLGIADLLKDGPLTAAGLAGKLGEL